MTRKNLSSRIKSATGPSKELDQAIAEAFHVPLKDYSSSVDACLELIHTRHPTAHWHVGRAEDGVSLYASLADGDHEEESTSVTVPLSLLMVIAKFEN